jgi:hypothetical protein
LIQSQKGGAKGAPPFGFQTPGIKVLGLQNGLDLFNLFDGLNGFALTEFIEQIKPIRPNKQLQYPPFGWLLK